MAVGYGVLDNKNAKCSLFLIRARRPNTRPPPYSICVFVCTCAVWTQQRMYVYVRNIATRAHTRACIPMCVRKSLGQPASMLLYMYVCGNAFTACISLPSIEHVRWYSSTVCCICFRCILLLLPTKFRYIIVFGIYALTTRPRARRRPGLASSNRGVAQFRVRTDVLRFVRRRTGAHTHQQQQHTAISMIYVYYVGILLLKRLTNRARHNLHF